MFAIAIIPVAGFMGAAVDYSRAAAARSDLQAALDAAALIVFRDAATSTTAQLDEKALAAVRAQFNRPEATGLAVKATYTSNPTTLTVTGSAALQSDFMRLVGVPEMNIGTSATVSWGFSNLRVALALDNTGSMSDAGKMDALKTATKGLLANLQAASKTPGDIQVAIVPFAKNVNVGKSNVNASWIDWTAWNAENRNTNQGRDAFCDPAWIDNGVRYCFDGYSAVQFRSNWAAATKSFWGGCVMDRDQSNDVNVTTPVSGTRSTLFPAETVLVYNGQSVSNACPVALLPLTTDWTLMRSKVDQMQPAGPTNQTIGLVWAWHALRSTAPLNAPALDTTKPTQQYIILLSDGLNTQNRWSGNGSSVSSEVDARMALVCANAKAAGIQIYTVQVNTGGDASSTVLRNCASTPEKFYELKTASAMVSTFNTISTELAALRISK